MVQFFGKLTLALICCWLPRNRPNKKLDNKNTKSPTIAGDFFPVTF